MSGVIAHLVLNNIPFLDTPQFIHSPKKRVSWLFLGFGNYRYGFCEHLCAGFCVGLVFNAFS